MKTELIPQYENKKSFYHKAFVINEENKLILRSYQTEVAYIDLKQNKAIVKGSYSPTTLRHIKEFLKQNGFKAETKAQILKDYSEEVV